MSSESGWVVQVIVSGQGAIFSALLPASDTSTANGSFDESTCGEK